MYVRTRCFKLAGAASSVVSIGIPGALITVLLSVSNIVLNNFIGIYGTDAGNYPYGNKLFSSIRRGRKVLDDYDDEKYRSVYPGSDTFKQLVEIKRCDRRTAGCGNDFSDCLHCNVCKRF